MPAIAHRLETALKVLHDAKALARMAATLTRSSARDNPDRDLDGAYEAALARLERAWNELEHAACAVRRLLDTEEER